MKIHLPFCTTLEVVGHRPGEPLPKAGTQTDDSSIARRFLPIKLRRLPRPDWADHANLAPAIMSAASLSIQDATGFVAPRHDALPFSHASLSDAFIGSAPCITETSKISTELVSAVTVAGTEMQWQTMLRLRALQIWLNNCPAGERLDRQHIAQQFHRCLTQPTATEISLNNFQSVSSLPPIPPAVKKLTIWDCPNLAAPLDLSAASQLTDVYVSGCNRIAMPDFSRCKQLVNLSLSRLDGVTDLDVSGCDRLAQLILLRCQNLTSLNLSGCTGIAVLNLSMCPNLTTLPPLGQLQQLRDLNLSNTPLTSLPDDILHLHADCDVQLDLGYMSDAVRNRLCNALNAADYTGPQIQYNMGTATEAVATLPIDQEVAAWRTEAPKPLQHASTEFDWSALTAKDNVAGFATFLARIRETNDYRNATPALKQATQQRVATLLAQLQTDPSLREDCFNLALDAVNTCGDRVALRLMDMEQLVIVSQARAAIDAGKYDTDPQALVDLCKGQYRLAIIAAAAENKVAGMHFTDPIEVHLGYLTKLAAPCKLPVRIATMLYPACAGVTDDDLAVVHKQLTNTGVKLNERDANDRAYQKFLAGSDLMRRLLTRLRPADMSAVNADNVRSIEEAKNTIRSQLDDLRPTDSDYCQHNKQLMAEFHTVASDMQSIATLPLLKDFMVVHQIHGGLRDAPINPVRPIRKTQLLVIDRHSASANSDKT